jgi:hypothetical protein
MVRPIIPVDPPEGILCGFGPLADPSKADLLYYPPSLNVIILWFKRCGGDDHRLIDMRFVTDGMVDRVDAKEREVFVVSTDNDSNEQFLVSVGKYDLAGIVLLYVLVDGASEARPALGVNQTLMRGPDRNGPTTYKSSLRNGPSYLRDGNSRHVSVSPNG